MDSREDLKTDNPSPGMRRSLQSVLAALSPARRRQFYLVLVLMMLGAFAEFATIGAAVPFLSLLAGPDPLAGQDWALGLFELVGARTDQDRLAASAIGFMTLALAAGALRLQLAWSSQSFVFRAGHELSVRIERQILHQSYAFHLGRNSSDLMAALEKVGVLVLNILLPLMQAVTSLVIGLFIVTALVMVDAATALFAATAFAALYLVISVFTRRLLERNGRIIDSSYAAKFQLVQESLGAIRDVIIDGSQDAYVEAFRKVDGRMTRAQVQVGFVAAAPRFLIEAIGMVGIALVAILLADREGSLNAALPILGALALGAMRLLPLLQHVYNGWSLATGHRAVLPHILSLLALETPSAGHFDALPPLPFKDCIRLDAVSFSYSGRSAAALRGVSLDIPCGSSLAIIGKTGSGKSSLADLLMGLIEPTDGRILVDGTEIGGENRRRWWKSIAHVPQAIFLADTSIARNIAFGARDEEIDCDRVVEAARQAQLHEFIAELPDGYDTLIGERGIRLSGGQRQRLGIARAIYKQSPVLILDEATSALDDATEAAVIAALEMFGGSGRTIIMVAHRLSTIAHCDRVARLDKGRLVEIGSFAGIVGKASPGR